MDKSTFSISELKTIENINKLVMMNTSMSMYIKDTISNSAVTWPLVTRNAA